jgi:hypothetical protein
VEDFLNKNEIIKWFYLLQNQVGKRVSVIIIASKLDLLKQNLKNKSKLKKENFTLSDHFSLLNKSKK